MTPRTWALNKALKAWHVHRGGLSDYGAKLLEAEHARSVRIVKAEIKRVRLDQHTLFGREKDIAVDVLNKVLAALQRGRTGRGK